jgi:hypothetical protein
LLFLTSIEYVQGFQLACRFYEVSFSIHQHVFNLKHQMF